jgi:hypoxanthine phosphoribosyltransferase
MEKCYIGWPEFDRLTEQMIASIEASGRAYDLIVGVARGGIPAALKVANQLSTKINFVNVKSYRSDRRRRKPKILSTPKREIRRLRLLVIDDIVDSDNTMKTVVDWLDKNEAASVETAALFVKRGSDFVPTYLVRTVDDWIVFPWERG